MALKPETIAKLTTSLSGDIELYNEIINEVQTNDSVIEEKDKLIQTTQTKLEETEQRGQQYLGQISNLLSKIPVGNSSAPQSMEAKIEEIKNRTWQK